VIIRISEAIDRPKKNTHTNRKTQINGKFNDITSADENKKKISLYSLYLKTIKRQHGFEESMKFCPN
jgi:hypothetical protein